jgi:hippurate hydrolase
MHACGHDVHMTVLVGAVRELSDRQADWSGILVCIAQPAEERSGGAKAMLADGLYERFPRPDYALALHVTPDLAAGEIGLCPGYAMANVDMLDITVRGRGGHGAIPERALDPVVLSARIVLALQTIVSREISPLEPAVITVGSIHGGTKGNVIPDEVKLELTLRSYSDEVRQDLLDKIGRICRGEAIASGVPQTLYPVLDLREEYTPSLYNDPQLTEQLAAAWEHSLGEARVKEMPPKMVGEDFGRYGRTDAKVPLCMFWLGASDPAELAAAQERGESLPALHTPRFAPDAEAAIRTGTQAMTAAVLDLLHP